MPDVNQLTDPTALYCAERAKVMRKMAKGLIAFWYKLFRSFGCSAVDSLGMARHSAQADFDKCDFTVNFDGPMA